VRSRFVAAISRHVNAPSRPAAESLDLTVLQNAQQHHLLVGAEFADLIEKERCR
jgi:hypothetical protein